MKKLKHLTTALVAVIALALAAGSVDAKEWKKVRIGTEGAYPPFNEIDSAGNLVGFDIDITNALCAEMKVECTIVAQDWDGIIPGLLAKKYDAIIASMTILPERMKVVDFTDKYYKTSAHFVKRKDSGVVDISRQGLKGLTLGAQKATTSSNYLEDVYKGHAKLKFYDTQPQANLDLKAGRLDAVHADTLPMLDWLASADGKCCELVGPELTDPNWFGYGTGIAVRKEDDDLREMINKAIAAIRKDGTYQKINAKYFPYSIY